MVNCNFPNFSSTYDQLADIFVKRLSSPKFLDLTSKLMGAPPISLRGYKAMLMI